MASALDSLIQAYKPVIENTSHASPKTQLYSQQLGTAFMNVIMLPLLSGETLSKLSPQHLQLYTKHLLEMISINKEVSCEHLTFIIGRYITDYFSQFYFVKEVQQMVQYCLAQSIPQITLPAESNQTERNQNSTSQDPLDPHVKKVSDYLAELEAQQDELHLLCKQMQWQWRVNEYPAEKDQYSAVAEIDFDFKGCKQTLKGVFVYKNKKFARKAAIFKLLSDVYLGYPEVWSTMETIKLKQEIKFAKDPTNKLKFISAEVINQKIQPKYPSYRRDASFFKSKEDYLSQIQSFKAQINLLEQQCRKTFKSLFWRTEAPGQLWRAHGKLTASLEGKEKIFEWSHDDKNSKLAEEVVAKRLIEAVYVEYVDIFQKMAAIKRKKNIRI